MPETRLDILRQMYTGHIHLNRVIVLIPHHALDMGRHFLSWSPHDLVLDMASDHLDRECGRQVRHQKTPRHAAMRNLVLGALGNNIIQVRVGVDIRLPSSVARDAEALGPDFIVESVCGGRIDERDQCLRILVRARIVKENTVNTAGANRAA